MNVAAFGFASLACLAAACPAAAGEPAYASLFEVRGRVETSKDGKNWKLAKRDAPLHSGTRLRTGADSEAYVIFDPDFERVLALGAGSETHIVHEPDHFRLVKGRLYVILEPSIESTASGPKMLTVLAGDWRAHFSEGGALVERTASGSTLHVYGGQSKVSEATRGAKGTKLTPVPEGFWYGQEAGGQVKVSRMSYADYGKWNAWVKRWYEKKDDALADRLQKELSS